MPPPARKSAIFPKNGNQIEPKPKEADQCSPTARTQASGNITGSSGQDNGSSYPISCQGQQTRHKLAGRLPSGWLCQVLLGPLGRTMPVISLLSKRERSGISSVVIVDDPRTDLGLL
jgi:hypothetical protein